MIVSRYIYYGFRIINGLCRILFYKLVYGKSLVVKNILYTSIGKDTILDISKSGKINVGFKFHCREFIKLKASGGQIAIGDNVFMNRGCSITSRYNVTIGDDCLFGEDVKIYDHDHEFRGNDVIRKQGFKIGAVRIGNNVWVGSNCTILRGVSIGNNCVIGANTLINKNIPDNSIVYSDMRLIIRSKE